MSSMIVATIKGVANTSIDIIISGVHKVGDIISFNNIIHMVPSGEDCTHFFYNCINFCKKNGQTKSFRIESISNYGDKYEIRVSPVLQQSGGRPF